MKKTMTALAVASVALLGLSTAAQAAPWQSINQRQAKLDNRIDRGIRDGSLTRREAMRLRNEFHQLDRLEQRYRRGGLSWSERRDLDRRFDRLEAQIKFQRHDGQDRRY